MNQINEKDRELLQFFNEGYGPSSLVFWVFRYFLGRRTIQADWFAKKLANAWPNLHPQIQDMICHELEEAFRRDDKARQDNSPIKWLGDDCDREAWALVRARSRK